VIPAHDKDFQTLHLTLTSIRRCCPEVRRIFVVVADPTSAEEQVMPHVVQQCEGSGEPSPLCEITFLAEGDRSIWPFDICDIKQTYSNNRSQADVVGHAAEGSDGAGGSFGWILQQLLKLYSPLVRSICSPFDKI